MCVYIYMYVHMSACVCVRIDLYIHICVYIYDYISITPPRLVLSQYLHLYPIISNIGYISYIACLFHHLTLPPSHPGFVGYNIAPIAA